MAKFKKGDRVRHVNRSKSGYPKGVGQVTKPEDKYGLVFVHWGDGTAENTYASNLVPLEESAATIIRKELVNVIKEAMQDRNAQCMSCGSYFKSESSRPQNCPKCLSEDIDVLSPNHLETEAAYPGMSPNAEKVYSQFVKDFGEPASQVLKLFVKAVPVSRYKMIVSAAKSMGVKLNSKDVQIIHSALTLWVKKEKRVTLSPGSRSIEMSTEGSRSFGVECQECGKRFKTASMSPRCPKCKGYDIDLDYSGVGRDPLWKKSKSAKKEASIPTDYETRKPGQFLGIKNPRIDPRNGTKVGFEKAGNMMRDERAAIRWAKKVADAEGVDTKVLVGTGYGGGEVFYVWKRKK